MAMNRNGEKGTESPNRSQRFFEREEYWYYSTREGVDIGPFDTLNEAKHGVSDFIDFILHAEPNVIETFEKCKRIAA